MNFAPMKNAMELLKKSSDRYSKILSGWQAKGSPAIAAQSLDLVNADLLKIPRLFLNQKGLPERPWFKNQIYAPGVVTRVSARSINLVFKPGTLRQPLLVQEQARNLQQIGVDHIQRLRSNRRRTLGLPADSTLRIAVRASS